MSNGCGPFRRICRIAISIDNCNIPSARKISSHA
jgi:hydrogenase small subunit